jgi:hypothetical protein
MPSGPNNYENLGAAVTAVVKAGPGTVYSLTCYNANAASRHLILMDRATVGSTGVTIGVESFLIPASSQVIIGTDYFGQHGRQFNEGITMGFSTTRDLYTEGVASEQSTRIKYT